MIYFGLRIVSDFRCFLKTKQFARWVRVQLYVDIVTLEMKSNF